MRLDYLSGYLNVYPIYISSINNNFVSRVKSQKASADKENNLFLVISIILVAQTAQFK